MTGKFQSDLKSLNIELNNEISYVIYAEKFILECQMLWRRKPFMNDVAIIDYCMRIEVWYSLI